MRAALAILPAVLTLGTLALWSPSAAQEVGERQSFIGAEACGRCHAEQYEAWKQSPHGNALHELSPIQQQDTRCTNCHSFDADERFEGVQCETCHGPGGYYHIDVVMRDPELARALGLRDPDETTCSSCHTLEAPTLAPFDYADRLTRMGHCVAAKGTGEAAGDAEATDGENAGVEDAATPGAGAEGTAPGGG